MADGNPKSGPKLGFLTVLDDPQHGLIGGYLILNATGLPLQFHCTAPIKPNRAQEILYGPTLEPFLYGEQIGLTLLKKATVEPSFVCTDRDQVLAVRQHVSLPVALVLPGESPGADNSSSRLLRLDGGHTATPSSSGLQSSATALIHFQIGQNRLAVPERLDGDRQLITQRAAALAESFDLAEPFGRIREAINEAQKAVQ